MAKVVYYIQAIKKKNLSVFFYEPKSYQVNGLSVINKTVIQADR